MISRLACVCAVIISSSTGAVAEQTGDSGPEARAVAFLAREVPRWRQEHPCYSCHNNGDAARALLIAADRGYAVGSSMDDTLEWLQQPKRWNESPSTGGIDDKPLARIQFASALRLAVQSKRASPAALDAAATLLAANQKSDGSWQLDSSQSLGSPTTYGAVLATAMARTTLAAASAAALKPAVTRADAWLRALKAETVLDAASVLIGLGHAQDDEARAQRERSIGIIRSGQSSSGGWGPYVNSPPETFDTALVLLALTEFDGEVGLMARGRAYLLSQQLPDGSWPETTRPSGQESYAQRISTTGWALLALLETASIR